MVKQVIRKDHEYFLTVNTEPYSLKKKQTWFYKRMGSALTY